MRVTCYTVKNKAHGDAQEYARKWHNVLVDDKTLEKFINDFKQEIVRINETHKRCNDIELYIHSYHAGSLQVSIYENFYIHINEVNRKELTPNAS